jgi:hypothetical protein
MPSGSSKAVGADFVGWDYHKGVEVTWADVAALFLDPMQNTGR